MKDLFLALLAPEPLAGPVRLGGADLEEIRALAERRGLLLLLLKRLDGNKGVIEPAGELTRFLKEREAVRYTAIARSVRQEDLQREVSSVLGNAAIPSVVLRGSAIARELYQDPYCRVSADIDLLVRRSDVLQADAALSASGYRRGDALPLNFWLNRIHHAVYVHPETRSLIEVHWNFGIPSYFRLTSEEIWAEVIQRESGQYGFTPEMTVIQLLIHHHMHAFRELKILVDVLWALHKYDGTVDWKALAPRLKKIGLAKTTLITVSQLMSLWQDLGGRMAAVAILPQQPAEMDCRLPGHLGAYFRMDITRDYRFQSLKDRVMSRLALDSAGRIGASFAKSLFPMPEDIKALYGDKRNWTLPFNYSRFIGWRLAEWKK
jgi:hypothetical protein